MGKKYSVDRHEEFEAIDKMAREMLRIDKKKDLATYLKKKNDIWERTFELINTIKAGNFRYVDTIKTYDHESELDFFYDALEKQLEKYNDESKSFTACVFSRGKWDTLSSFKTNTIIESIDDEENFGKDDASMVLTQDVAEEVVFKDTIVPALLEIGAEVVRLKKIKPTKSSGYYQLFYTESVTTAAHIEQELIIKNDTECKIWRSVEEKFVEFFCLNPVHSLEELMAAEGKPLGYFDGSEKTQKLPLMKAFPLVVFSKYIKETNNLRSPKLSEAVSSISEWKTKYTKLVQEIIF